MLAEEAADAPAIAHAAEAAKALAILRAAEADTALTVDSAPIITLAEEAAVCSTACSRTLPKKHRDLTA